MRPFYNEVEKMNLKYALQKMKIEKLSKHCYRELSGGQQQESAARPRFMFDSKNAFA